jgi:GTPase SAR1 family protein
MYYRGAAAAIVVYDITKKVRSHKSSLYLLAMKSSTSYAARDIRS